MPAIMPTFKSEFPAGRIRVGVATVEMAVNVPPELAEAMSSGVEPLPRLTIDCRVETLKFAGTWIALGGSIVSLPPLPQLTETWTPLP